MKERLTPDEANEFRRLAYAAYRKGCEQGRLEEEHFQMGQRLHAADGEAQAEWQLAISEWLTKLPPSPPEEGR